MPNVTYYIHLMLLFKCYRFMQHISLHLTLCLHIGISVSICYTITRLASAPNATNTVTSRNPERHVLGKFSYGSEPSGVFRLASALVYSLFVYTYVYCECTDRSKVTYQKGTLQLRMVLTFNEIRQLCHECPLF